ncbi:MGH1-like glycoside hydrolase domain-containing protein [Coraliomargarita sp. W4R72]
MGTNFVERDGKRAESMKTKDGNPQLRSEAHFRLRDGDHHVPKERLGRPDTWVPKHDHSELPIIESGFSIVDAAYRLALDETKVHLDYKPEGLLNASEGRPPWVRDTSYVVMMGADAMYPEASKKTLEWCVLPGQTIKPEQVDGVFEGLSDVVPTYTTTYRMGDFVIWIPAVWQYARTSGDFAYLESRYSEMVNSLKLADDVLWDRTDGLFDGGDTIGDGFSIYPENTAGEVMLKGTSINFIYFKAFLSMAEIAEVLGKSEDEVSYFRERALNLRAAINRELWVEEKGYFSLLKVDREKEPLERAGLSGNSFSILWSGTSEARQQQIIENQPDTPWGAAIADPPWLNRGSYHDQNVWPVIEGLWATATARAGKPERTIKSLALLTQNAAFQLSFSEMWGMFDGLYRGKEPQLWSCTAVFMEWFQGIFGLIPQVQGLEFAPSVPAILADGLRLKNYPYRDARITFNIKGQGSFIRSFKVDGRATVPLLPTEATGNLTVDIEMTTDQPLRIIDLPDVAALGEPLNVAVSVDDPQAYEQVRLLVLGGPSQPPVYLPVEDGRAVIAPIESGTGRLQVRVVAQSKDGRVLAGKPHTVFLSSPLTARFKPGALEFSRPVQPGEVIPITLELQSHSAETFTRELRFQAPRGWELQNAPESIRLEPKQRDVVVLTLRSTAASTYGATSLVLEAAAGDAQLAELPIAIEDFIDLRGMWVAKELAPDALGYERDPVTGDAGWSIVRLPMRWQFLKRFENAGDTVWFRRSAYVPEAWRGQTIQLSLGDVAGEAEVYLNGHEVKLQPDRWRNKIAVIESNLIDYGANNLIAIKIKSQNPNKSGLLGWPMELRVAAHPLSESH